MLAALLFVVGGAREAVRLGSRTVSWNVLVGAAYVPLAIAIVASFFDATLLEDETIAWIMAGAAVLGSGSLAWFGV